MSNSYLIGSTTVLHKGGGVYELTKLGNTGEPEQVRGKENAEKRAQELSTEASTEEDEGRMQGQSPEDMVNAHRQGATISDAGVVLADPKKAQQDAANAEAMLAENTRLRAQVAAYEAMQARTVEAEAPPEPHHTAIGAVPQHFSAVMDDTAKAALKAKGIETTDITLEESETIPPTGLFVGHNGRGYMIKPGERVTIPNFIRQVLDDAVMSTPIQAGDHKVTGYRDRSKYPYRVHN